MKKKVAPKVRNAKAGAHEARRVRVALRIARSERPRLTVYRSSKHMYAQLVDASGRTLGTVSTRSKEVAGEGATGNVEAAKKVGRAVAELARRLEIGEVVFHRNGFLYHGRVKALADAAREAGLRF
jgi:large subunit ribosomal protein L18